MDWLAVTTPRRASKLATMGRHRQAVLTGVVITLLFCCLDFCLSLQQTAAVLPPSIVEQAEKQMTYKSGDRVELPCAASGFPIPEYSWTKDGAVLRITGVDMKVLPGAGTLVIEEPSSHHGGIYQCLAINQHGIALSIRTVLKLAVLDTFETNVGDVVVVRRVRVGESLTLRCDPPHSHPPATVYWTRVVEGDSSRDKPIEMTRRIATDYDGNLYLSNVEAEDLSEDGGGATNAPSSSVSFMCFVLNRFLRSVVQGTEINVQLVQQQQQQGVSLVSRVVPHLLWSSSVRDVAVVGQSKRLKCIFGGYPTPFVSWRRADGAALSNHSKVMTFGLELDISPVEMSDAGRYVCSATTDAERTPASAAVHHHHLQLIVEASPSWSEGGIPVSATISEEGTAVFECLVSGSPQPTISWYRNGIPIEDLEPDSRLKILDGKMALDNVTTADIQVVQCNATNRHGYVFANAFLNVVAFPPRLLVLPPSTMFKAEDQRIVISCQAIGAPSPRMVWTRGSAPPNITSGSRFNILPSGDLEIETAEYEDSGIYRCSAINKFGTVSASTQLSVRRKTQITVAPQDVTLSASRDVELKCVATTDAIEMGRLRVEWLKNAFPINHVSVEHRRMNGIESILKIKKAKIRDTGNYTCRAGNTIDSDNRTAQVVVADLPDSPYNVTIVHCLNNSATIVWTPGSENNAQVTNYLVYLNASYNISNGSGGGALHLAAVTDRSATATLSGLLPWQNYTFYVEAQNRLGRSRRSDPTLVPCSMPPQRPTANPNDVCTEDRGPEYFVITWKVMSKELHNGEGFHYIVSYRSLRSRSEAEVKVKVTDWRQGELVVANQTGFREYEIYVEAANREGRGPEVRRRRGYSGEDVPLERPENLHIRRSTLKSTSVEFAWTAVDERPERIRGFFRGYQIQFWRPEVDPSDVRTENVIFKRFNPCPAQLVHPPSAAVLHLQRVRRADNSLRDNSRLRTCRWTNHVKAFTHRLWPHSRIAAAVLVLTATRKGNLSDPIEFLTPQGVPGQVVDFQVTERGSHHLRISWLPPEVVNGVLTGFIIGHRKAEERDSTEIRVSRNQFDKKLRDLEPMTRYVVYVLGVTSGGRGTASYIEEDTREPTVPDTPYINALEIGDDFIVVNWKSSLVDDPSKSPGDSFRLHYRKIGSSGWNETEEELHRTWINLTHLESDATYEIQVVAIDALGRESQSESEFIGLGPETEVVAVSYQFYWWSWVAAALSLFALIISTVGLTCYLVCRRRCGKYSVQENEALHRCSSSTESPEIDATNHRNDFLQQLSRGIIAIEEEEDTDGGSMESLEKRTTDVSDLGSSCDYESSEITQFNEDGSFIGQYTTQKTKELEPDITIPSAMSVLV